MADFSNAPAPVVISASGSLAMAAAHPMEENPWACDVVEDKPDMESRPLTAPPVLWLACFPPGGWYASSRGTRSSRLSLEPLPPADEPIRRGTLAALKRLECCPAPGRAQRPCSRRAQARPCRARARPRLLRRRRWTPAAGAAGVANLIDPHGEVAS